MMAQRWMRQVARRARPYGGLRGNQTLPEGLKEITSVPRAPSWSLTELHQEGAVVDQNDAVLNEDKLRELAELCHLQIDDAKLPSLLKDVESIIQCTKTIQAVTVNENIDDLYGTDGIDLGTAPLREDVVTEGNCADQVLANAAERSGYFFKVPKVLQD
ncbi:hypothetical protein Poli38472_001386 [Pythium oligandrum]|uniref:Glu-AdT subunit C n=1 Tax=Pythium oligandrum TaxID=41045 RepID=A0A8K1CV37_PYTOL|nr:hypothetical protein Poli38472_001386 [Pythium oligandrum]|eukprot:TMW69230.1 hypothetical protein Poli38472_001386 [Pythium oligandrum]